VRLARRACTAYFLSEEDEVAGAGAATAGAAGTEAGVALLELESVLGLDSVVEVVLPESDDFESADLGLALP
jgi:hypothetical protein